MARGPKPLSPPVCSLLSAGPAFSDSRGNAPGEMGSLMKSQRSQRSVFHRASLSSVENGSLCSASQSSVLILVPTRFSSEELFAVLLLQRAFVTDLIRLPGPDRPYSSRQRLPDERPGVCMLTEDKPKVALSCEMVIAKTTSDGLRLGCATIMCRTAGFSSSGQIDRLHIGRSPFWCGCGPFG